MSLFPPPSSPCAGGYRGAHPAAAGADHGGPRHEVGVTVGAERAIAAARGAIGAEFRPQGRDPAFGLDCVGLAALAARAGGFSGEIPAGYALRGGDVATLAARFDGSGLVRCASAPGAIALFETGPAQFHLAVLVHGGIVHADAMLRRVVERPGPAPWRLLGCWCVTGE